MCIAKEPERYYRIEFRAPNKEAAYLRGRLGNCPIRSRIKNAKQSAFSTEASMRNPFFAELPVLARLLSRE